MASIPGSWQPTKILDIFEARKTGSRVLRVETDQGEGFLKAMGVDNGPNVLACELVGTLLAEWLKLQTLSFALIDVPGDMMLRFADGKPVEAGPGFITRAEEGRSWIGDEEELDELDNPEDICPFSCVRYMDDELRSLSTVQRCNASAEQRQCMVVF